MATSTADASDIPQDDEPIRLTAASAEFILDLIENPPEPNARLLAAVQASKELICDEGNHG